MSVIPAVVAVAGLIGDLLQKRKVEQLIPLQETPQNPHPL